MTPQYPLKCNDCGREVGEECPLCPECIRDHAGITRLLLCALALLLAGLCCLALASSTGW